MMDEYGVVEAADNHFYVPSFQLESGVVIRNARVAYRSWGKLAVGADNGILVAHALTGNAAVDTWWGQLMGVGKALDTSKHFIVCANMLGSPYGTTCPLDDLKDTDVQRVKERAGTSEAAAGSRFSGDFPYCTIRDNVKLQRLLLAHLGVEELHAVVGGSAGGMQALEWVVLFPEFVQRAVVIACGAVQTAWQIAVGEAQRQCIYSDPDWNEGYFALDAPPLRGLSTARQSAMVWYRSPEAYQAKFGRRQQLARMGSPSPRARSALTPKARVESELDEGAAAHSYAVEGYLEHQGEKFVERFDANCYVSLTHTLDSHDVGRGRGGVAAALAAVCRPVTVVGISSDILYPLAEQRELVALLPNATLRVVESAEGHDAFLLEHAIVGRYIREALEAPPPHEHEPDERSAATAAVVAASRSPCDRSWCGPRWKWKRPRSWCGLPRRRGTYSSPTLRRPAGPPLKGGLQPPPHSFAMPTAAVLSSWLTAEMVAKRRAADAEALTSAQCLGAVWW